MKILFSMLITTQLFAFSAGSSITAEKVNHEFDILKEKSELLELNLSYPSILIGTLITKNLFLDLFNSLENNFTLSDTIGSQELGNIFNDVNTQLQ